MKECRGLQAQGFECNFEGAAVGGSSHGQLLLSVEKVVALGDKGQYFGSRFIRGQV
jgi:hypothetical protein